MIKRNVYVSDVIWGTKDFHTSEKLKGEFIELFSKGQLNCTNDLQTSTLYLMTSLLISANLLSISDDKDGIKALGLIWLPEHDSFQIMISNYIIRTSNQT